MKNYYEVLGVNKNSNENEIKKAYRKMSLKYHPDRNLENKKECEEKFKEISKAYQILSDSEKRKNYDLYGDENMQNMGMPNMSEFNPFDLFSNVFGGNNFKDRHKEEKIKSPTRQESLNLPLDDLYTGKLLKINFKQVIKCRTCDGIGCVNKNDIVTCELCDGNGVIIKIQQLGPIMQKFSQKCYKCNGKGRGIKLGKECPKCNGSKVENVVSSLQVNIKKGSKNGDKIVFYNKGDWHPEYKEPGDLHLIIKEGKSTNGMVREGGNLLIKEKISLYESLCGLNKVIKHMDGRHILMKFDGVINPYHKMIIKNEGMMTLDGIQGDLIIEFIVLFPESIENKRIEYLKKILVKPEKQIWEKEVSEYENLEEYELEYFNDEEKYNTTYDSLDDDDDECEQENIECVQQ